MKKRPTSNGKKQTEVFNVRLEVKDLEKLRKIAEAEHRTVSNLVQLYLHETLARGGT